MSEMCCSWLAMVSSAAAASPRPLLIPLASGPIDAWMAPTVSSVLNRVCTAVSTGVRLRGARAGIRPEKKKGASRGRPGRS